MSHHITAVTGSVLSLGADPKKGNWLLSSIYKASRIGDDCLPDYDGIVRDQLLNSPTVNLAAYGQWSYRAMQPLLNYSGLRNLSLVPIPLKTGSTYYGDGTWMDSIPHYKMSAAVKKVVGKPIDRYVAALKKNDNLAKYARITIVFGVPATTQNNNMLSVMFDAINQARQEGVTSFGFDADPSKEQKYDCNMVGTPVYTSGSGVLPGRAKGECWIDVGLTLTRQNVDTWEQLTGFDIQGGVGTHSWRGKLVNKTLTWSEEMNNSSTGLFLPVTFENFRSHIGLDKATDLTSLTNLLVVDVTVISLPFYARGIFKIIVIIVMVIITLLTAFTSAPVTIPAMIAATGVTAAVTSILSSVIVQQIVNTLIRYIITVIIEEIIKMMLKPLLGKNLASLIGGIIGSVVGFAYGGNFTLLNGIDAALKIANQTMNYITQTNLADTQRKQLEFDHMIGARIKDVDSHWDAHGMKILSQEELEEGIKDPVSTYKMSQTDVVCKAATITAYDIIQIERDAIKEHFRNGTDTSLS